MRLAFLILFIVLSLICHFPPLRDNPSAWYIGQAGVICLFIWVLQAREGLTENEVIIIKGVLLGACFEFMDYILGFNKVVKFSDYFFTALWIFVTAINLYKQNQTTTE
jgi:hypothetical protein